MSRKSRKQIVGKREDHERAAREDELRAIARLVRAEWWSRKLGRVSAREVLELPDEESK